MEKKTVVEALNEIADLLDIKGVEFKPRAYRRAARELEALSNNLDQLHKENKLDTIPGVGKNIAKKISELMEKGNLAYLEQLRKEIPVDTQLLKVRELGPKTVKQLYENLGVKNLTDLEKVASQHKIRDLKGLGAKTEQNIAEGLNLLKQVKDKHPLAEILPPAKMVMNELEQTGLFSFLELAGSLRRKKYLIGDVDILATTDHPHKAMDVFTNISKAQEVLSKGETKSSIRVEKAVQIDLRIVNPESLGAALQYFTGSKEHNVRLRELAIDKNFKLNEYGLFTSKEDKKIAGGSEEEIYNKLGLSWIPPELREDRGEITRARNNTIPQLVSGQDIKGDFHCHTTFSSDARMTLEQLIDKAKGLEYDFIAVTDHATMSGAIQGIDTENVDEYLDRIEEANANTNSPQILSGIEANIQKDGALDLPQNVLSRFDIVLAGIHSHFNLNKKAMTDRMIQAMENRTVNVIAHPRGRKIGEREEYELDFDSIFTKAKKTKTALEINASVVRSDLDDPLIQTARDYGVKLAIGTDSHLPQNLDDIELGLYLARRGWCEKTDLLNCSPLSEVVSFLNKK